MDIATEKEINQHENTTVLERGLSDMAQYFKIITTKLSEDSVCYLCKRTIPDKEHFGIIKIPEHKISKGMVGFVSICKDCNK